jgi:hypothetical protein
METQIVHNITEQQRIGENSGSFQAATIIYMKISARIGDNNGLEFYEHEDSGTAIIDGTEGFASIDEFIKNLVANSINPADIGPLPDPKPDPTMPNSENPLDFHVPENCFIVFELDRDMNMTFRPKLDGISTDSKTTDMQYFNLWHLDENEKSKGTGIDPHGQTSDRGPCRFAYFSAVARPDSPDQKRRYDYLNLYVRLNYEDGTFLDMILDPDVQNPGGPHNLLDPPLI